MTLSCTCDYCGFAWYYYSLDLNTVDFESLDSKRRKRCESCNEFIEIGADCLSFQRFREPRCYYEEERFGDEVPLADKFLCSKCGEIWLNLTAIGYCLCLGDDMRESLREYWELTGFKPETLTAPVPDPNANLK